MYPQKRRRPTRGSAFMNGLRRIKNKFQQYIVNKLRTGSRRQANDRIYQYTGKLSTSTLSSSSTIYVEKEPQQPPLPQGPYGERNKTGRHKSAKKTKAEQKSQRIKEIEDRQKELFLKSGPQMPKSQRKAERKAAVAEYKLHIQQRLFEGADKPARERGPRPLRKKEKRRNVIYTPGPSAVPQEPRWDFREQERIQRELFRKSGPQIPKRQRKRERYEYCREQRLKHER